MRRNVSTQLFIRLLLFFKLEAAFLSCHFLSCELFVNSLNCGLTFICRSVTLHIRPSGFVEDGTTPIPPTPDLYTQLLKKLSEMQTGANGKDGRSAYEIAIENGFVGTAAEWLKSLKGRDGLPGKDGADGLPGKSLCS